MLILKTPQKSKLKKYGCIYLVQLNVLEEAGQIFGTFYIKTNQLVPKLISFER